MKIKIAKTVHCGYIYEDGHAVLIHRERHPKAGEIEWAEIFEKIDTHCNFDGRLVFHHPRYDRRLTLALEAYALHHSEPTVEHGSENTKRQSIRVCTFRIEYKDGKDLHWTTMPDLISDGITYQPDCKETFNPDWTEFGYWGDSKIDKIHRLPKAQQTEAVA